MKNNNKVISVLFIVIFFVIFSLNNYEEYSKFHQSKIELEERKTELSEKINNFKLSDIKSINNIQFYYTPNKDLLTKIVTLVENAKKEIYLETYMLTEKRIQEALIKTHKKGVPIKIILEKDPYLAYNINNKAYEKLKRSGIDIIWSNKQNYSYNHTKVLLIDDLSIISTGNYSYSTFTQNRDFFIFTTDENIKEKLKTNFYNDYNGVKFNLFNENLIFSPHTSRIKFEKMFDTAEKSIKMYFQYFKDDKLVNKLINIKKNKNIQGELSCKDKRGCPGVEIIAIIPDTAKDDPNIILMKKAGIQINIQGKYKMHAKSILIDNKFLFIGSINFSKYSIDKNREVGILINNTEIIEDFLNIFNQDIQNRNVNIK